MLCDYYIVRKGYLRVKELYTAQEGSAYRFVYGFSWQAYASYIAGILVNIVGFAGAVGRKVPVGAQYIYNVNYFSGIVVSALMYYTLTRFFPIPATSSTWSEVDQDVDSLSVAYGEEVDAYDVPEPTKADSLNYGTLQERKVPKAGSSAAV